MDGWMDTWAVMVKGGKSEQMRSVSLDFIGLHHGSRTEGQDGGCCKKKTIRLHHRMHTHTHMHARTHAHTHTIGCVPCSKIDVWYWYVCFSPSSIPCHFDTIVDRSASGGGTCASWSHWCLCTVINQHHTSTTAPSASVG